MVLEVLWEGMCNEEELCLYINVCADNDLPDGRGKYLCIGGNDFAFLVSGIAKMVAGNKKTPLNISSKMFFFKYFFYMFYSIFCQIIDTLNAIFLT